VGKGVLYLAAQHHATIKYGNSLELAPVLITGVFNWLNNS
jgi:hypothetical protein